MLCCGSDHPAGKQHSQALLSSSSTPTSLTPTPSRLPDQSREFGGILASVDQFLPSPRVTHQRAASWGGIVTSARTILGDVQSQLSAEPTPQVVTGHAMSPLQFPLSPSSVLAGGTFSPAHPTLSSHTASTASTTVVTRAASPPPGALSPGAAVRVGTLAGVAPATSPRHASHSPRQIYSPSNSRGSLGAAASLVQGTASPRTLGAPGSKVSLALAASPHQSPRRGTSPLLRVPASPRSHGATGTLGIACAASPVQSPVTPWTYRVIGPAGSGSAGSVTAQVAVSPRPLSAASSRAVASGGLSSVQGTMSPRIQLSSGSSLAGIHSAAEPRQSGSPCSRTRSKASMASVGSVATQTSAVARVLPQGLLLPADALRHAPQLAGLLQPRQEVLPRIGVATADCGTQTDASASGNALHTEAYRSDVRDLRGSMSMLEAQNKRAGWLVSCLDRDRESLEAQLCLSAAFHAWQRAVLRAALAHAISMSSVTAQALTPADDSKIADVGPVSSSVLTPVQACRAARAPLAEALVLERTATMLHRYIHAWERVARDGTVTMARELSELYTGVVTSPSMLMSNHGPGLTQSKFSVQAR